MPESKKSADGNSATSLQDMELERDDSGYVRAIHCTGEEGNGTDSR